jgi:hypothetical protein
VPGVGAGYETTISPPMPLDLCRMQT